jgi:thioredoxin reductase
MGMQSSKEELLVVVGGGAAGVYGAIRAKTLAPNLDVLVVEKGNPLSKVMFFFFFPFWAPANIYYRIQFALS